ncbi:MAG: hypothetical protein LBJ17_04220 [Dysgonamonadaceae bacterium]|jgi:hypothetical protein|nr:hypothetical protein [Dysgonamonadaceae bacterium]
MKKVINTLEQIPKWYALGIAVLYGFLFAEYFSTVSHLISPVGLENSGFYDVLIKIMYFVTAISGIVVWIVSTFFFHLTAVLFKGKARFKHFLKVSAYPYIVPAIIILIVILVLDRTQITNVTVENAATVLADNQQLKLATLLVNLSFVPYYAMIAILIHYIHGIKWLYAALSVIIPAGSAWAITQLLKTIL